MSRIHPALSKPFDAIIVGGGPAGSATAGLLARAGLRALLIEATHYEKPSRLETLPPAVKPRLARLGAWSRFERQRHDRIDGTIAFWGNATHAVDEYAFSCYENAWLAVVPGNARARQFYEGHGWRDAGSYAHLAPGGPDGIFVPARRYVKKVACPPTGPHPSQRTTPQ